MDLRFSCATVPLSARRGAHVARISTSATVTTKMCVHVHVGSSQKVCHACSRSVGATIPAKLRATCTLWHMLLCASARHRVPSRRVLQYPPSVHIVCVLGGLPYVSRLCHARQPCTKWENDFPHINQCRKD